MAKTFGTKKNGSAQPETQTTVRQKKPDGKGGGALKLLFGVLAAVAVGLFVYNNYFNSSAVPPANMPTSAPVSGDEAESRAALRGAGEIKGPRFPELDHYLQADHVNPNRARMNRYGRTSTLLAGCGVKFDAVRRDYQRDNHAAYLALRGSDAPVQDEDIVYPVPPDQSFSRSITARECSYVSQQVRLGEQNI